MQAAPGAPLSSAAGTPGPQPSQPSGSAGPDSPAPGTRGRRIGVLIGVGAFVLALDAITKAIVVVHLRPGEPVHVLGNILMLDLLRNSGAAFSVGTGYTIVFTAIAVIVVAFIVRTVRNLRSAGWAVTLGLLLGGALGNLADRVFRAPGLFRGNVVDWIELTRYWPVFNVADSAIVCGGILTVLLAMLGYHLDGTRGDRAPASPGTAPAVHAPPAPAGSHAGASGEPGAPADAGSPDAGSPADAGADAER